MNEVKNYGLLLDTPAPEHWVLGSSPLEGEVLQQDKNWLPYLPKKEYQSEIQETFACVLFTMLNCVEILIKRKYGEERNYSDIFLAKLLETQNNGGSSPQQAGELLRKAGVPKEEVWGIEHLFTEIPQEVVTEALKFLDEFEFKHEFVPITPEAISFALKCSPLLISVAAWFKGEDGRYYRPAGMQDNHATTLVYELEGQYRQVFDSYADGEGDPSLKEIEWGDLPIVCKRFHIEKKVSKKKVNWFVKLLQWLFKNKRSAVSGSAS
jgi:hypothetical protein